MKKLIVILLHGWQIVLYLAVVCATLLWLIELNLFSWQPKISLAAIGYPIGVIAIGLLVYYNSRKINHKFGLYLNIILCLFIVYYGWALTLEEIKSGWFGRSKLSPLWFRLSQIIMLLVPVVASTKTIKKIGRTRCCW